MHGPELTARIRQLLDSEQYDEVARITRDMASSGDRASQFIMGYLYFTAADVSWSDSERWLRAAADQEHAEALYYLWLGTRDQNEESGQRGTEAVSYLRRAANLHSRDAQRDLGCLLCLGESGFAQDEKEGRAWYLAAAKQGHTDAQYNVAVMMLAGEGGDADVPQALQWLRKAVQPPDSDPEIDAAKILAHLHETGEHGVEIDATEAQKMRELVKNLEE